MKPLYDWLTVAKVGYDCSSLFHSTWGQELLGQQCRWRKYGEILQLCICIKTQLFCKITFAKIFICSTIDLHTDCEYLYTIIMLAVLSLIYLLSANLPGWQLLAEITATLPQGRYPLAPPGEWQPLGPIL